MTATVARRKPVRVAVTGAAGQIGYALLFRIAAGDMLGPDQPVKLHLVEVPAALDALKGVVMELEDGAFPLLDGITVAGDPLQGFRDVNYAILVGAKPRGPGMQRKDLILENGPIFTAQGRALDEVASRDVRVLVVGNPANTNALIALNHAPSLSPRQFSAMSRLDHNRARSLLAGRAGCHVSEVRHMAIWGNHSSTQFPDLGHAIVGCQPAVELVDPAWISDTFIPTVQERGAAVIAARGASSAASAAAAIIDHVHDWALGNAGEDWVSMSIPTDGSYGIADGLVYSFPVSASGGDIEIVDGLKQDEAALARMRASEQELVEERDAVRHLLK